MLKEAAVLLYGLLLAISIYNIVSQYKNKKIINAFICFQAAFILYYILTPILALIIIEIYPYQLEGFVNNISKSEPSDIMYAFIYTLIAYTLIMAVYRINLSSKINSNKLKVTNNNKIHNENFIINRRIFRLALVAGMISLLIGIIAQLVIANSLGGVINAIVMGDKLRAFGSDTSYYIPQNQLFVLTLMVISLASSYFLFYALRIYKSFIVRILFLISMLSSIFYLLLNAGRMPVLLFVLTFLFDYAFRKTKHPFIFMGVFSILGLILLGALDDFFFYLSYGYIKESSVGLLSIINEFAFPYLNILHVDKINEIYGLRWGIDYFSWVINIVPTSILNIFGLSKIASGYSFITEYYRGGSMNGGIPTDFLTLGIRQFGLVGIIVNSVVISIVCKFADKIIDRIYSKDVVFMILRISSMMFIIVPYADLDAFVRNRYDMILVLLFAILVSWLRVKAKEVKL